MNAKDSVAVASEVRRAFVGSRVRAASLGVGSIILMDLDSAHGTVHLRTECAWSLLDEATVLCACEDARAHLAKCLRMLVGLQVDEMLVSIPGLRLEILFGKLKLHVFPIYSEHEDADNWTVHAFGGLVFVAGPGREATITTGDKP